jgi:WD40 repeat protein
MNKPFFYRFYYCKLLIIFSLFFIPLYAKKKYLSAKKLYKKEHISPFILETLEYLGSKNLNLQEIVEYFDQFFVNNTSEEEIYFNEKNFLAIKDTYLELSNKKKYKKYLPFFEKINFASFIYLIKHFAPPEIHLLIFPYPVEHLTTKLYIKLLSQDNSHSEYFYNLTGHCKTNLIPIDDENIFFSLSNDIMVKLNLLTGVKIQYPQITMINTIKTITHLYNNRFLITSSEGFIKEFILNRDNPSNSDELILYKSDYQEINATLYDEYQQNIIETTWSLDDTNNITILQTTDHFHVIASTQNIILLDAFGNFFFIDSNNMLYKGNAIFQKLMLIKELLFDDDSIKINTITDSLVAIVTLKNENSDTRSLHIESLNKNESWIIDNAHNNAITAITSLDNELFATASYDKNIKIWNIKNKSSFPEITIQNKQHIIFLEKLRKDILISVSIDGSFDLWNYQSGEHIKNITIFNPNFSRFITHNQNNLVFLNSGYRQIGCIVLIDPYYAQVLNLMNKYPLINVFINLYTHFYETGNCIDMLESYIEDAD